MDEHDVLQHLLNLETEAAALVDDAQAEADRRLGEAEKQNRSLRDERYSREAAELEAGYTKEIEAIKEDYKKQLDTYRESLAALKADQNAFSALARSFLLREH